MANNRRIFIINPRFQYKFSFIICSLVFLASLIYPITIYDLMESMISLNPDNASQYEEHRISLLITLALIQFGLLGFIFVVCIRVSHRIAGPMYKMQLFLENIRQGEEIYPLSFRDGDQFHEVAEDLNDTIEYLTSKSEEEREYLGEVSDYIENIALVVPEDKKPVLEEIQRKIKQIQGFGN